MAEEKELQATDLNDAQLEESIQHATGLQEDENTVEETASPAAEEVPAETQPETPPQPTLEERLSKLEAQLLEKEKFIQRQGNEIGMLRKQASRPPIDVAKVREEIKEQFQTDPLAALTRAQALQRYAAEVQLDQQRSRTIGIVPDLPDLMDDICEIAKAEGENDETLAKFRQDPFRVPEAVLYDYAVRARAYKYAKVKSSEAESLRKQIEELRKGATTEAAVRIDQAAKSSPVIRASSGGGTSSVKDASSHSRLTEAQIHSLSDKELNELLSKRSMK